MKLHELRQLLIIHEKSWYPSRLMRGEFKEVVKIKQFISKYNQKPDDYEFTVLDRFELLKIISVGGNLQIIESIKASLCNNHLFEIFMTLNKAGFITLHNFETIDGLTYQARWLLFQFYCVGHLEKKLFTSKVLEVVLATISNPACDLNSLKECLSILSANDKLTPMALRFISKKAEHLRQIAKIFTELSQANCLSDTFIKFLSRQDSFFALAKFFTLLNKAKIEFNEELINLIFSNDNINNIAELLPTLINSDCHVTHAMIITLLEQQFDFFINKSNSFQLLQANGMLDDKAFEFVCGNESDYSFQNILKLLSAQSLLIRNKTLIDKITDNKIDIYWLNRAIKYLHDATILDQDTLQLCANKLECVPDRPLIGGDIFQLIELLQKTNVLISKDLFVSLFKWSELNIKRLYSIVSGLLENNLLNIETFNLAVERVSTKLPVVNESSVQVISRKQSNLPRTEVVLNDKFRYFKTPGKKVENGGYGKVKIGYSSESGGEPVVGIKKLLQPSLYKARNEAIREVKYHRLLGRQAFYFAKSRVTVVAEWQREKVMNKFTRDELMRASLLQRLQCLSSGLVELNHLHHHYRVHGDVKCQNIILDLNNLSMKLIDFGTTHKKGATKRFGETREYADPGFPDDHYHKDIYAMGIVVMQLFPEIYTVTFNNGNMYRGVVKFDYTPEEQSIVNLVGAMMHPDYQTRCTSEDALTYCNNVIGLFYQLDERVLQDITSATLDRTTSTVEDIMRDSVRMRPQ